MNELLIQCPICGERLPQIDRAHALKHGSTGLKDFREAYGITYTTLLQRSREKIKQLYNVDFARWGLIIRDVAGLNRYVRKQYFDGDDYSEAKERGIKSASRYPLNDTALNNHFKGTNPVAIFARGDRSRYFGFDVDSKELAPVHTLKIVTMLEVEGIPREHIHVSYSGGKGYHIELFTDKHIEITQWNDLGEYILHIADLIAQPIEFRPNRNNSHAWKLPLTYHHKTGYFAGYCDNRTLEVNDVARSHDYLFAIEQMSLETVVPLLRKAERHKAEVQQKVEEAKAARKAVERKKKEAVKITDDRLFRTDDEKRASVEDRLKYGLIYEQTRWSVTCDIAVFLFHEYGNSIEEVREQLIEWTEREIDKGRASTPIDEAIREIDSILAWVQTTNCFYATIREITITRGEIDWVLTVPDPKARDLLWALLLRSKAHTKQRDGTFYTSRKQLQDLLSKPRTMHPTVIAGRRQWLIDNGYIEAVISKPHIDKTKRKASTYRLLFVTENSPEVIDSVEFNEALDCRELLRSIAAKLFDVSELQKLKLA
jgi:hypothetical protein